MMTASIRIWGGFLGCLGALVKGVWNETIGRQKESTGGSTFELGTSDGIEEVKAMLINTLYKISGDSINARLAGSFRGNANCCWWAAKEVLYAF